MPMQHLPEFSPGAPGGVCFVCRSARRPTDTVIDFFVDPDELGWVVPTAIQGMAFELAAGNLEICSTCITEAAQGLGMVTAQQATKASAVRELLEAKIASAEARADVAEAALRGLLEYRRSEGVVEDSE